MISKTNNPASLITDFQDSLEQNKSNRPENACARIDKSLSLLDKTGFPTVSDEDWKYTNLKELFNHQFVKNAPIAENIQPIGQYGDIYNKDELNIVFINGHLANKFSTINELPKGLSIQTTNQALQSNNTELLDLYAISEKFPQSAFSSLNTVLSDDTTLINIEDNAVIETPIHIIHYVHSDSKLHLAPRCIIKAGKSSQAHVVESYLAFSNETVNFTNSLTDIYCAENSTLHYIRAQSESLKAFHISNTNVWVERDANFQGFSFMTGAVLTRNDLNITLNGEGCHATLNGLYPIRENQHVDNHSVVDHTQPNCTSNQLYKGILNGSARSVFNGKIFVRSIAQLTNSYQLNNNLLLGENCRVDTKPQLEIFADDVKCTHGATIGQLDEDQLFYLQSRAMSKQEAIKTLSRGFADEITDHVQNASIKNKLDCLLTPTFHFL